MNHPSTHKAVKSNGHARRLSTAGTVLVLAVYLVAGYYGCGVPDNIHGKTNAPPIIKNYYPQDSNLSAVDGQFLNFWIIAEDPDNNPLVYNWQLNGNDISNGTQCGFSVSVSQGTRQVLTVVVSDPAGLQAEKTWLIYVTM